MSKILNLIRPVLGTDGNVTYTSLCKFPINSGAKKKFTLGKEDYIKVSFSTHDELSLNIGDGIDDDDIGVYKLKKRYKPTYDESTHSYKYDLQFDSYYMLWANILMVYNPSVAAGELSFGLTGRLELHSELLKSNLKANGFQYRGLDFVVAIDSANVKNEAKLVECDGTDIISYLNTLCDKDHFNCEWWVVKNIIYFGKCEYNNTTNDVYYNDVEFEIGKNCSSMKANETQDEFANRVYVFGGTNNITGRYRKKLIYKVSDVVAYNSTQKIIKDSSRPLFAYYFKSQEKANKSYSVTNSVGYNVIHNGVQANDFHVMFDFNSFPCGGLIDFSGIKCGIQLFDANNKVVAPSSTFNYTLDIYVVGQKNSVPTTINHLTKTGAVADLTKLTDTISISDEDCKGFAFPYISFNFSTDIDASTYTNIKRAVWNFSGNALFSLNSPVINTKLSYNGSVYDVVINHDNSSSTDMNILLPAGLSIPVLGEYTLPNIITGKVPSSQFTAAEGETNNDLVYQGTIQKRLMLPVGTPYIQTDKNLTPEQIKIAILTYDDIYPRFSGQKITSVSSVDHEEKDGNGDITAKYPIYTVGDKNLVFDKNCILENTTPMIIFQTGLLAGNSLSLTYLGTTNGEAQFRIEHDDKLDLPNSMVKPTVGDEYVLYNIDTSYYFADGAGTLEDKAEQELFEQGEKDAKDILNLEDTFDCSMISDVMKRGSISYQVGQKVTLRNNNYFAAGTRDSRVIGYEICLDKPYDKPVYSIGNSVKYSLVADLENKIEKLKFNGGTYYGVAGGSNSSSYSIYVVNKSDTTKLSDTNVMSSLRAIQELDDRALSKQHDDRTEYNLGVGKDLTVDGKATISELIAKALSVASATIVDLTATTLKATSATILGALTAATVSATTMTASTFIGDLQGNAATSTKLKTPINILGIPFDGSTDCNGNASITGTLGVGGALTSAIIHSTTIDATTFIGALQGNAMTASKWKTPIKVWGQSIDGGADVNGTFMLDGNINSVFDIFNDANIVRLQSWNNRKLLLNPLGNNVGIGITNPNYKLDVAGDINSLTVVRAAVGFSITNNLSIDTGTTYVRMQSVAKDISLNPAGYSVGINTTTPQYKLDVSGNMRVTSSLYADASVGTRNFESRTTGWQIGASGAADFRNIYADELNVLAFTAQVSQALAGSDYLTKSVSRLSVNFTIPNAVGQTARLIVDDLEGFPGIQCFANNDYIRLRPINRNGGLTVGSVYGTIALDTSFGVNGFLNGTQAYIFTAKSITNGAGLTVYKGAEVLDYGTNGSGLIKRTTLDAAGSPYMDIATWANDPSVASNLTTHVRLGNLSGMAFCSGYGLYSDNVFLTKNILIGDFTKAGNYLSFDTQNGLQIKLGGARVATTSDISSSILAASSYTDSQVSVLNNALSAKVSQADFNLLGQRVSTAETNITSNANSISAQATNINNLTGRISTAEAKITSDAINLTVKSQVNTSYNNAVSVAATDATIKANAAYSNAVSYTNSQITATNNSITAAVNSVQIGGRNLARHTATSIVKVLSDTKTTTILYNTDYDINALKVGDNFTINFDVTTTADFKATGTSAAFVYLQGIFGRGYVLTSKFVDGAQTAHISVTSTVADASIHNFNIRIDYYIGTVTFTNFKLEKSTKETAWSPAPEDIAASIATAQSTAISTAASNAAALYVTQSAYSAQVSILQNSINAKVSQTDFNALGSRISTAESNITQNANNIASKVSATDYTGATIASLINQSADSVVISANHINIQGAVTFSSFSSNLQSTINGKATTSYVDSNVSTCLNKASTAQTTANTALTNAATANNTLANALGGKTIIVGGYIDTNLLEANSIVTKALTSSTIIANNATIANLNMVNANVSGVINATSGKFGCLITDGTEYGEIYNEGLDSEAMLVFTYKSKNVSTKIGTNIFTAMTGIRGLASFKNSETNYNYGLGYNYGISVTAENADTNVALSIGGGYVQGLALKVGMFYGGTESNPALISRDVNVALLMTTGWYQFPDMQTCDDGHFLMIKRLAAGSSDHGIRVKTNLGWHASSNTALTHTQAGLIVDQGWYGTDVTIGSLMDSMTYIYCRDLNWSSYHGMWVEWKNPRDW